nr:uncharacterized protein LOC117988978 isoform X1 [Maniola hyperantus]
MAEKTVSFNTHCSLYESQLESIARWLSCNGEVLGMGPTAVFASAAALFLYNELQATVFIAGDHGQVSLLEKTLVSTMVLGMLALMIHLWVCSMRFFQYYLDTLIKDSPSILLEMTTASLLGKNDLVALGPLTRFLKQQQPQIHITVCWLLSLCYADYVRKNYCQRFNMPYLEQWLASRVASARIPRRQQHHGEGEQLRGGCASASAGVQAGATHQRGTHSVACSMHASSVEVRRATSHVSHECAGLVAKRSQHVCRHLVAQSSDTAAAIEKLRAFVAETRCSCNSAPNACESASCPSVLSYQKDLLRKPSLEIVQR